MANQVLWKLDKLELILSQVNCLWQFTISLLIEENLLVCVELRFQSIQFLDEFRNDSDKPEDVLKTTFSSTIDHFVCDVW